MDAAAADDKIQAVVRLVLQAVDQRLESVREQLVQVSHSIAANHAELTRRIDECQQMAEAVQVRMNQFVNDREVGVTALTEVVGAMTRSPVPPPPIAPPQMAPDPVAPPVMTAPPVTTEPAPPPEPRVPAAPAVPAVPAAAAVPRAKIAPRVARPSSRGVPDSPAIPEAPAVPAEASSVGALGGGSEQQLDLAALSAQISARLAAAVDRALGELPATGMPGVPSNSA